MCTFVFFAPFRSGTNSGTNFVAPSRRDTLNFIVFF